MPKLFGFELLKILIGVVGAENGLGWLLAIFIGVEGTENGFPLVAAINFCFKAAFSCSSCLNVSIFVALDCWNSRAASLLSTSLTVIVVVIDVVDVVEDVLLISSNSLLSLLLNL